MSVTAKLSKAFYDSVGEKAANELVEWFNAVDATYRADLEKFNELNFARFDAKLDQRISASEAKLGARIDALAAEMRIGFASQGAKLERRLGDQTRFMYLAWATILAAVVGLYVR